ncbi:nicotinate dehydrogenase subunit A [Ralstonia sp. 25mfcol4.1]|uniref:(2Fe-2S)-binding protein n=1 Tax=Burkholderiaceae TaxID=119060 RepID=UPI0008852063|nr:(2Fe-2S)-binding protein [Ralstonia sp. 25mfcol4.1]SDP51501.1 nicotinate dehydrogenase subunit A [Ralstonia sp. 25mfcol4.1]
MPTYQLQVNGKPHAVDVDSDTPLLYVLRDNLGLHGPKFGCGLGQCGACTVLFNGTATRSCVLPVASVGDARITTLEGLGTPDKPHPVQQAFIDEQAAQCGYCINGMVMTSVSLLAQTARPTEEQIRNTLAGNLCRCGTHTRIIKAVQRAAQTSAKEA